MRSGANKTTTNTNKAKERDRQGKEHDLSSLLLAYYYHFSRFTILSKNLIIIFMSYYGLAKNRKEIILARAGGRVVNRDQVFFYKK